MFKNDTAHIANDSDIAVMEPPEKEQATSHPAGTMDDLILEDDRLSLGGEADTDEAQDAPHIPVVNLEYTVTWLPAESVVPSPVNRNASRDPEKIEEMARTIEQGGLLYPLTVRPIDGDKHEIICGERRYRALVFLGQRKIPVVIKNITEEQAQVERIVENYERSDPTFFEQGEAVVTLLKLANGDYKEVARQLGQKEEWVRRRERIPRMIQPWIDTICEPTSPYAHIGHAITKMEEIAGLPAPLQLALLENHVLLRADTAKKMHNAIAGYLMDLSHKPWTWDWENHHNSSARRCDKCKKRSDRDNVLFVNPDSPTKGKTMCLDRTCWQTNCMAYIRYFLKTVENSFPIATINIDYNSRVKGEKILGSRILNYWQWKVFGESDEQDEMMKKRGWTAGKGVYVDGHDICKIIDIWHEPQDEDEDEDTGGTNNGIDANSTHQSSPDTEWEQDNALTSSHPTENPMDKAESEYNRLVTDILFHLENIEKFTRDVPESEVLDRKLRAGVWFGIHAFSPEADGNTLNSGEWEPLEYIWNKVKADISVYVAMAKLAEIHGTFTDEWQAEVTIGVCQTLCEMFAIPIADLLSNIDPDYALPTSKTQEQGDNTHEDGQTGQKDAMTNSDRLPDFTDAELEEAACYTGTSGEDDSEDTERSKALPPLVRDMVHVHFPQN